MNNLMIFDLTLLGIFLVLIGLFLYKNRKKVKKEGLLLLYHTSWGIKFINKIGRKYEKAIKISSHIAVTLGYILMAIMIWMFGRILWLYIFHGDLVRSIKIPPIMPLIPYLPQMFQLSWLPPFYFSYWIIILAIIAITHELFHGIFAKVFKVDTKTTGFGFFPFFFPVFLAAFVNLNEKIMQKRKSFEQRAVLAAGTFANTLTAIIGVILMWVFFSLAFSPAGVVYDDYAYDVVNVSEIESINGIPIDWTTNNFSNMNLTKANNQIMVKNMSYVALKTISSDGKLAALYYDSPAMKNELNGAIVQIDGKKINSLTSLENQLKDYSPGEKIELTLYNESGQHNKSIILSTNPLNESKAWIGVTFTQSTPSGFINKISYFITSYKDPNVYYEPVSDVAKFLYDLLWWLVLISFSVALVNMLPVGIFDGGRFFYLTILSLTKSEKVAEKTFKVLTQLFVFALFVVMFFYVKNII